MGTILPVPCFEDHDAQENLLKCCCFRNIGVLQTTVAEMITVKEHQRKLTSHIREELEPLADKS